MHERDFLSCRHIRQYDTDAGPVDVIPSATGVGGYERLMPSAQSVPQPGELGVVAEIHGEPVGAAWLRRFTADDPGFGWVAHDVPELSIGVTPSRRGGVTTQVTRDDGPRGHAGHRWSRRR